MTTKLNLILALFPAALLATGCAHDRPENVRSAEPALTSYAAIPPAPPMTTAQRPSNADVRAELEAAQRQGEATASSAAETEPQGTAEGASGAATEGDAERRDFDAKVRARLEKVDARAREVKERAGKLAGTKKTELDSAMKRFAADRADAEAKLGALGRSAGGAWKAAKTNVERSVEGLESTVSRLADQM